MGRALKVPGKVDFSYATRKEINLQTFQQNLGGQASGGAEFVEALEALLNG